MEKEKAATKKKKSPAKESSSLSPFGLANDVLDRDCPTDSAEIQTETNQEKKKNSGGKNPERKNSSKDYINSGSNIITHNNDQINGEELEIRDLLPSSNDSDTHRSEVLTNKTETFFKVVTFFLDREEYALPITEVQEINRVGDIVRVPNSPKYIMGVVNLRGIIVPVIELKIRLKIGSAKLSKKSRIILVEYGPRILGLMVDMVSQVLSIPSSQFKEVPEEVVRLNQNYIKGIGNLDDRIIILLDLQKVILDQI